MVKLWDSHLLVPRRSLKRLRFFRTGPSSCILSLIMSNGRFILRQENDSSVVVGVVSGNVQFGPLSLIILFCVQVKFFLDLLFSELRICGLRSRFSATVFVLGSGEVWNDKFFFAVSFSTAVPDSAIVFSRMYSSLLSSVLVSCDWRQEILLKLNGRRINSPSKDVTRDTMT